MRPEVLDAELQSALADHTWGLHHHQPVLVTNTTATAGERGSVIAFRLHLLEDCILDVTLGDSGFETSQGETFETLDALLMHNSPLYRIRHAEVLHQRISEKLLGSST